MGQDARLQNLWDILDEHWCTPAGADMPPHPEPAAMLAIEDTQGTPCSEGMTGGPGSDVESVSSENIADLKSEVDSERPLPCDMSAGALSSGAASRVLPADREGRQREREDYHGPF